MDDCCAAAEPLTFDLPSGKLRANKFGSGGAITLCVHGLSANSRSFDFLGESLASSSRTLVAIDLRGRGWSDVTHAGTYGWANHARDVLAVADKLGAARFDYIGHSMGAYVGLEVARQAASRVERMVLIDAIGLPEASAMPPILAAVGRLGAAHATADAYVEAVRRLGTVEPWSDYWERHYRYDLVPAKGGGVSPRTHATAVLEDIAYASTQQPYRLWGSLAMPSLLVRAARPLGTGTGFIVSEADRDRFVAQVRGARAVDIDANHYGIITHAETALQIRRFFA